MMATALPMVVVVVEEEASEVAVLQPGHLVHEPHTIHLLVLVARQVPVSMHLLLVPELLHMELPLVLALQLSDTDLPLLRQLHITITAVVIISEATMPQHPVVGTLLPHQAQAAMPQRLVLPLRHQELGQAMHLPPVLPTLQLPVHQDTQVKELPELAPMMLQLLLLYPQVGGCTMPPLLPPWAVCLRLLALSPMDLTGMATMVGHDMRKALQVLRAKV